jgi:DNA-binding GntR family transcriptional regulator
MLSYPGSIELFHREHKEILEAFKLRNQKMVRELVENHVRSFGKIVVEILRSISPSESEYPSFPR